MPERTVHVSEDTEMRLVRLSEHTGRSVADLIRAAVEAFEARLFFDEMDETYAVLEADIRQWAAYMADLTAWIDADDASPQTADLPALADVPIDDIAAAAGD